MLHLSRLLRPRNLFTLPQAHVVQVETVGAERAVAILEVRGLLCALCAQRVQRALAAQPGVHTAACDLSSGRAVVAYDPARQDPAGLEAAVQGTAILTPLRRLLAAGRRRPAPTPRRAP